jgi:DNA-binding MarR family transcriptional regulator
MVVKSGDPIRLAHLDIGYLGFFLGLRVNEMVRQGMESRRFKGVRDSHGYLIQHLLEYDRSITELARGMEISQQAVSKTVAELITLQIVETVPAADRRSKRIRLSARGRECVRIARMMRVQIERRLRKAVGRRSYGHAKENLVECLNLLGGVDRIQSRRVRQPD